MPPEKPSVRSPARSARSMTARTSSTRRSSSLPRSRWRRPKKREVLAGGQVRVDGQVLGDVADGGLGVGRADVDRPAGHDDLPAVTPEEAADHRDGGGLAGAVRAEQAVGLAGRDLEADAVDGLPLAVALAKIAADEDGLPGRGGRRGRCGVLRSEWRRRAFGCAQCHIRSPLQTGRAGRLITRRSSAGDRRARPMMGCSMRVGYGRTAQLGRRGPAHVPATAAPHVPRRRGAACQFTRQCRPRQHRRRHRRGGAPPPRVNVSSRRDSLVNAPHARQ